MNENIPEIELVRSEYRRLKRLTERQRSKLKSLFKKYSFTQELTNRDIDHDDLVISVRRLFNNLNFRTRIPTDKRDVDLKVRYNGMTLGIEVKTGNLPSENDFFQALKYTNRDKHINNKVVHPLIVWNNAITNQEFDQYRINDATINKYSIITTKELLKGFLRVKQEKISVDLFNEVLNQTGLIKFSNKELGKAESRRLSANSTK